MIRALRAPLWLLCGPWLDALIVWWPSIRRWAREAFKPVLWAIQIIIATHLAFWLLVTPAIGLATMGDLGQALAWLWWGALLGLAVWLAKWGLAW